MKRAVSGLLFVVILTACIFVHPLCFFALFLVINVLGILEFARLAERLQVRMNRPMCLVSGVLLFAASFLHNYWGYEHGYLFFMAAVLALAIWELYRKDAHAFQNLAFSYYVLAYFTLPFALLVYFPYMCNGTWQPDIIFYPFLLMWLNDTFAYLVGTQFGKHKLFPRISPKKSWEGLAGSALFAVIGTVAFYGFGFTAYMLFLILFSKGERQTAHYAICTAFMAMSMMLPGMAAGWLQESLG